MKKGLDLIVQERGGHIEQIKTAFKTILKTNK